MASDTRLYDILGVKRGASASEIKRGYRKAAKQAHPDSKGGSKAAMQEVNKAYLVLRSPERRARYDSTGEEEVRSALDDPDAAGFARLAALAIEAIENSQDVYHIDLLGIVRARLLNDISAMKQNLTMVQTKISKLEKACARFSAPGKLVTMILTHAEQGRQVCETLRMNISQHERMIALLETYKYDWMPKDYQEQAQYAEVASRLGNILYGVK